MENLTNKIALITGGSKGIGYGIAESLLKQGMKVAITSRTKDASEKAAAKLKGIGKVEVLALEADVRNAASQQNAVDEILKKWGQLDVLVANAGIGYFGSIETLTTEDWQETIDTNLTGVFHSVKATLPALKKTKGFIITI